MSVRRAMMFGLKNYDVNAIAFIATHESNTGLAMGGVQKTAVNNLYLRFKGIIANPNSSNLWSVGVANNTRAWIYCPVNDSTANALAYNVEFFTQSVLGTFNNFVSGDFTPQGVIGGATKFFNAGVAPSAYALNDVSHYVYSRTSPSANTYLFGANDAGTNNITGLISRTNIGQALGYRVNDANTKIVSIAVANAKGLLGIERTTYNIKRAVRLGVVIDTETEASTTRSSNNFYAHGRNDNSTLANASSEQLAGFIFGLPQLTANQKSDLNWIINLYQQEVITGGRNV